MLRRINEEELHASLHATPYEKNEKHLKRFLKKHFMDIEVALNQWHGWVEWRHENNIDSLTAPQSQDLFVHEVKEGVMVWKGQNKQGMPCCLITGRMLDPIDRGGSHGSFRKYMLKMVDEGLRNADELDDQYRKPNHHIYKSSVMLLKQCSLIKLIFSCAHLY